MEASNPTRKILLADDQAFSRLFVGKVLRQTMPCTVIEAQDGEEAIALCESQSPDLVILDISMPRKDGLQALAAIRARRPGLPVVMLTSTAEEKVVEECVNLGASYFIRKDVPASDLQAELKEMLQLFPPA